MLICCDGAPTPIVPVSQRHGARTMVKETSEYPDSGDHLLERVPPDSLGEEFFAHPAWPAYTAGYAEPQDLVAFVETQPRPSAAWAGLDLDAVNAGYDEKRKVGGTKSGPRIAGEVARAWRVDEVYPMSVPIEGGNGKTERDPAVDFFGLVIEHRGPLLDRSLPVGCASDKEQRLGKACLPAAAMSNQGDVTDLLWNHLDLL